MNSGPLLFLGLFVTMACSWLSFVMGPQLQIGDMRPTTNIVIGASGQIYPNPEPGAAHQGAEVYRANGCVACHTQQVRPREMGSDLDRGWGTHTHSLATYSRPGCVCSLTCDLVRVPFFCESLESRLPVYFWKIRRYILARSVTRGRLPAVYQSTTHRAGRLVGDRMAWRVAVARRRQTNF